MALTRRRVECLLVCLLVMLSLTHAEKPLVASGQSQSATPPLSTLASFVPSDATSETIEVFNLSGSAYGHVHYTRIEQEVVGIPPYLAPSSGTRDYDMLYETDGTTWHQVWNSYAFAEQFFTQSVIGGPAGQDPIGFDGTVPSGTTALVTTKFWPLTSFWGDMPDMLAVQLIFDLGPLGIEPGKGVPTLAILEPASNGFTTAYPTLFDERGGIESVVRDVDSIFVRAPAHVGSDPACCPSGTEYLELDWDGQTLNVASRCTRPGRDVGSGKPCEGSGGSMDFMLADGMRHVAHNE